MNKTSTILKEIIVLLNMSIKRARADKMSNMAASLTYYIIFSLAPLFYIVIFLGGLIYERSAVEGEIFYYLNRSIGSAGTEFFRSVLLRTENMPDNFWPAIIGIAVLVYGSINFYLALHNSFQTIYGESKKGEVKKGMASIFKRRIISLFFVFGTGIFVTVMIFLNIIVSVLRNLFKEVPYLGFSSYGLEIFNFFFAFIVLFFVFSFIYKILSDFKAGWRDIMVGACISSFLFIAANFFLGLYFKYGNIASFYGVGGSIIVTLIWIYYSSQIFLFGIEIIKSWERMKNSQGI